MIYTRRLRYVAVSYATAWHSYSREIVFVNPMLVCNYWSNLFRSLQISILCTCFGRKVRWKLELGRNALKLWIWQIYDKCTFCLCFESLLLLMLLIKYFLQVLVVAFLAAVPIIPKHLSHRAYRLSFMGTTCSSLYSLYSQYGVSFCLILKLPLSWCYDSSIFNTLLCCLMWLQKPRAWNMQALQVYFQSIIATKDFIYFVYCLTFVTSHLCLKCEYSLGYFITKRCGSN